MAEPDGLPVGPGGQLIGSTPTNHPFLLPLTEPGTLTRIYIDAELWAAQQLVLRALPSGATTRVTSSRPEQWWPMIRSLAEPRRLWLSQTDRLSRSDTARVATVQVCDHCPEVPQKKWTRLACFQGDIQGAFVGDG